MLVLEGLSGLHKTVQLQFFSITGQGIDLDYCDIEWFALKMNRDHSVFEIATSYCILNSFVVYDGYSISSPGDLPDPGTEHRSHALQADSLPTELPEKF